MSNKIQFKLKGVTQSVSGAYVRVTDKDRNELYTGQDLTWDDTGLIDISLQDVGVEGQSVIIYGDVYDGTNLGTFKSFTGVTDITLAEKLLKTYDTVVGVGDSISQGEYDLSGGQFDEPFRGVNWRTGAEYGTTLSQIKDNITDFTSQAEGRTLFIIRAGINDCNTYLSSGGVSTGSLGDVLAWSDMSEPHRASSVALYRDIITLLKEVGDVALGSLTYCNAKGNLLPMSDKGRNLHSGSWSDECIVPLCEELTPEWFNTTTGRPVFDYYMLTYDNPETQDEDNLHYYSDYTYTVTPDLGYVNGPGSYTLRNFTIDMLAANSTLSGTPYDSDLFSDRILIDLGRGAAHDNRPSYQRWCNLIEAVSGTTVYENLTSHGGITDVSLTVNMESNGIARGNLYTSKQPWSEGLTDRNICSSSVGGSSANKYEYVLSGVTKGVVSAIGIHVTEGGGSTYDPIALTVFRFTDDVGTQDIEVQSSIDGLTVNLIDCVAEYTFDSSTTGVLTVEVLPGTGSPRGTISGIQVDVAKES